MDIKINKHFRRALGMLLIIPLCGCTSFVKLPIYSEQSTQGEVTHLTSQIKSLPIPKEKFVVGVYKFRDQTGQYKAAENGASWSTAIPQGTTTILIKALEDSKWFKTIERENIGNLLNERQIIRTTRKEYMPNQSNDSGNLPPLLYAGIILEGGVVSYDTNVVTGGLGARYFGIGASTDYRQDRITVYLRAVSTQTGEILKSVYTSKNILSTKVSGNFFRFIDVERLLEAEVGVTQNEPVQLAVTEAIEKSVYNLIVEGVRDNLWGDNAVDKSTFATILENYDKEVNVNDSRIYGNIPKDNPRSKFSIYGLGEATKIRGDYKNPVNHFGGKVGMKYFLSDNFNVDANGSYFVFENKNIFYRQAISGELNLEFLMLAKSKFTPYFYGGGGLTIYGDKSYIKSQVGGGLEYLISRNFAVRLGSQYDLGLDDKWDFVEQGRRKDNSLRYNIGLNYYFSKKTSK